MEKKAEEIQDPTRIIGHLIQTGDRHRIVNFLKSLTPVEVTRTISRLDKRQKTSLIEVLGAERSADIFSKISRVGDSGIFEHLSPSQAGPIVEEMNPHDQTGVLRKLKEDSAELILKDMKPTHADKLRQLTRYPENTAGGLMITEFLSYTSQQRVKDVLDDLQMHGEEYSDFDVQYAYVVSETRKLIGVLRLRDLLLSSGKKLINEIMIKKPVSVRVEASLQELREFFQRYPFLGVPVTNNDGNLVGIVRGSTVREAANRRSNQMFMKFAGIVGGEEYRTMPLLRRSSRGLSWLSINILLNIIAASVIAIYQDTLEKAIVLAVFLPIISDMSGCSGNQAVAVSIRELTQGLVRPREIGRVLAKESSIGILNGIVLGCLLGVAALLWKGNPYLGLVVGVALAANTLVAVSFGGFIPLFLRGIKSDPALASGPLLTTITDMCGFFFVLSFASMLLPKLSG